MTPMVHVSRRLPPRAAVLLAALLVAGAVADAFGAPSLGIDDLRTEYLTSPEGLDVSRPRLSWTLRALDAGARGLSQAAYEVQVATGSGAGDPRRRIWDSGEVASSQTSQVTYGGPELGSGELLSWRVRSRDQAGEWSDWSRSASWTTGLMGPEAWSALWIGESAAASAGSPHDPWLRREFSLDSVPARAIAFVASVGFHELYVNGRKVGTAVLMPSVADNSHRARYVTYYITAYLHRGPNALGLWLGTGWSIHEPFLTPDKPAAPIVRAQFELSMPEGSKRRIVTDRDWTSRRSPSRLIGAWTFHQYGGEWYDANAEVPGWAQPGLAGEGWEPVATFAPALELSSERCEPTRPVLVVPAVGVTEGPAGAYCFDMGRSFSGWIEVSVAGQAGDRVDIQTSERSGEPMTFDIHSTLILGPTGKGVFRNRFNYGAGRWITVRGLRSPPALTSVRGWLVRSDYARASGFECSDPLLNRIEATTLWTLENLSLGGYLVDCPHRERMGYGGDAHATISTALMNYRTEAFFTKWSEDWRDVQTIRDRGRPGNAGGEVRSDIGDLPYTAPTYFGGGGPSWSGFCLDLPWELYRRTGDQTILAANFATIQRWIEFLETRTGADLLQRWGGEWDFLGDWVWPGAKGINNQSRDTLFFNNCYRVLSLARAAEIARLLGRDAQAAAWAARAQAARAAINRAFFDPSRCSYVGGGQACLGIALLAGVPAPESRARVWRRLEEQIETNDQGHIDAGITGGAFLFELLQENHRNDLLFTMVDRKGYPGWADLLDRGETTFGETWEGTDSLLHSSYLYVGAWFIEGVLGIQPGNHGRGFADFTIWPGPVDRPSLTWARGYYDSLQGRISVAWKRDKSRFELEATVPANTSALIYFPVQSALAIEEGGVPLARSTAATFVGVNGGRAAVAVGSGTYRFACKL